MKYAIIAAGEGSRLAAEGIMLPKPLVKVGGEAMIDRLIRIFMQNDADEIVVICNDNSEEVSHHLEELQRVGLQGRPVPLRFVVKSTPSSMHSLYEISPYLHGGPFVLTTVDTIFREEEFADYVRAFRQSKADGLMGVTSYIDDEKPLYVECGMCKAEGGVFPISGFYDHPSSTESPSPFGEGLGERLSLTISAGIYGLNEKALDTLQRCVDRGEQRMRNFQRALLSDGLRLEAYPFTKVFDVDHASDIEKANQGLQITDNGLQTHNSPQSEASFSQLLHASLKSEDTEEWLDVHFTRPIGLAFALLWKRLGVHPNAITILSIFLGVAAGIMFYFTDLTHNLIGVVLLMFANFCDSTDGQLARLTGKKTLVGRVLDGFAENVWFFFIYFAIVFRVGAEWEPQLGLWGYLIIFVLCVVAGLFYHSPQCSLADYYRQIHLYFLLGSERSELDSYASQRAVYESLPRRALFARVFYYNYANYCRGQEQRTPQFQRFFAEVRRRWPHASDIPQTLRDDFRRGSLPLMKYTNLLTFNARAIIVYLSCYLGVPWIYPLTELTVFALMYWHMHRTHEKLCKSLTSGMMLQK